MTNHVHLLMSTDGQHQPQDILRDHKRHTSEKLRAALAVPGESRREWIMKRFLKAGSLNANNRGFQLWQQHNHPVELWSREAILGKLDYIHLNPVRAGFCHRAAGVAVEQCARLCGHEWGAGRPYAFRRRKTRKPRPVGVERGERHKHAPRLASLHACASGEDDQRRNFC